MYKSKVVWTPSLHTFLPTVSNLISVQPVEWESDQVVHEYVTQWLVIWKDDASPSEMESCGSK